MLRLSSQRSHLDVNLEQLLSESLEKLRTIEDFLPTVADVEAGTAEKAFLRPPHRAGTLFDFPKIDDADASSVLLLWSHIVMNLWRTAMVSDIKCGGKFVVTWEALSSRMVLLSSTPWFLKISKSEERQAVEWVRQETILASLSRVSEPCTDAG